MDKKKVSVLTLIILAFPAIWAQQHPPAPPVQTARQALIEMVTGGERGLLKHLTVEAQQALGKQKSTSFLSAQLGMMTALKGEAGSDFQSFDTGSVLFSATDKKAHTKVEILVESDDLNGTEETMQVSYHAFRDGEELKDELGLLSPQIQVELKQQDNIWRLNEISVNVKFSVGDPEFLEKLFGQETKGATGYGSHAEAAPASPAPVGVPVHAMEPQLVLVMIGFAESSFAAEHPETGFTCSLPEILQSVGARGVDAQVATGPYNGYKFTLTGCEGKPAGSFQLIAEPVASGTGVKAYCTDATHNVRVSDDGRGSTCLSSGKVQGDRQIFTPLGQTEISLHP
jgi:hypothetical protein